MIIDLVVSGRHWSKFVHEKWEAENKEASLYDSYMENSDLQICQCIERNLNRTFHKVQKRKIKMQLFMMYLFLNHPSIIRPVMPNF